MKVAIIDYGSGNVRSVQFALTRLGVDFFRTSNPNEIANADKVIFPGVGTAGSVMKSLIDRNLNEIIPKLQQPVLGICIGMQLMCTYSEEDNTQGLGIFPIEVLHFAQKEKVPHMGWNTIQHFNNPLLGKIENNNFVYYVHSYYAPISEFTIASSHYQSDFSAMLKKDNFYACQFHPEKSGATGHQILQNFLFETI